MLNSKKSIHSYQEACLNWYDRNKRDLPWRSSHSNGYHTLLSEFMLQQTVVATVIPYFKKFTQKWPTIFDFAKADIDEILADWAGLGYYNRARNLHKAVKMICEDYDGVLPKDIYELIKLPGVGPYTAAAISAFTYDQPDIVVDGNIDRIMIRLFALKQPKSDIKDQIYDYAGRLTPQKRNGDYAQSLMDLGATICKPKSPACMICPISNFCLARKQGIQNELPKKKIKQEKPIKFGHVYLARAGNKICLEKRPEKGLLAGLYQCPTTEWVTGKVIANEPFEAKWKKQSKIVKHIFTHFELQLEVFIADLEQEVESSRGEWFDLEQLNTLAIPTLMQKVVHFKI